MEAKLVTYTTKGLNNSEKSILGKRLYGYLDKSNKSQYSYKRKGLLADRESAKVSMNTFLIAIKDWKPIEFELKKRGANIKTWDLEIKSLEGK